MKPSFATHDLELFRKYLARARIYLEWGSGGSTVEASSQSSIQKIYSIESDPSWIEKIKPFLQSPVNFVFIDLQVKPNSFGYPSSKTPVQRKMAYSNVIHKFKKEDDVDTILIDGRFRVACCLKSFSHINDSCVILFDDFLNRPHYHVVLKYFTILESTPDKRMVVLQKKTNVSPPRSIEIRRYELDPR